MFLRKGVLKICSKFTGEHPCPSAISITLQSNFIEVWFTGQNPKPLDIEDNVNITLVIN